MNRGNTEKEIEIKKSYNAQKIALYCLLALIYLSFIGLQLGRIQAIADFNYGLHEIMYLPFNVAIFVVPVLSLIYIFLFIKYLRKRGMKKTGIKTIAQSILIISSIIIIISITENQFYEVSTGGVFKVEQKLHDDRNYYLIIDGKKVKVSYNEFQLVNENQQYLISFISNKRTPDIGKLETIEPLE
jgi:membrane protein implicated in regulation of membrane protease activity